MLVRIDGLTAAQVSAARAEHGTNSIPSANRPGVAWRAWSTVGDPMLLLLMAAACLTIWRGDYADTAGYPCRGGAEHGRRR